MSIGQISNTVKFHRTPTKKCVKYLPSKISAPQKSGPKFTKSLKTSYAPMPTLCQISLRLAKRCRKDKSVTKFFYTFSILTPRTRLAKVHQFRYWCTARPGLWTCQISFPSDNPSTRYLLPTFVGGVSDREYTQTQKNREHVSAYHAVTKNNDETVKLTKGNFEKSQHYW